ncbi:unnamed protein product [Oikopleura dioica]|uniref:Sulfotransferase n=1 Tax=Oikopleura dioica TaxID=34765 RepID=E4YXJ5_OIKDI|nr:unnamed protein product [Oikopleura dioica]
MSKIMRCRNPLTVCGIRRNNITYFIAIYGGIYLFYIFCIDFMSASGAKSDAIIRVHRSSLPENNINRLALKNKEYVVFNRVPKCGSMSMTQLAYDLGGKNQFKVESPYEPGEKQTKSQEEQDAFRKYVFDQKPPYMYIRHQNYVDFWDPVEKEKVAYINMIRDPIARFESFYYFSRFGNNLGGGGRAKLNEERKKETVDDCVAKKRQECVKPWWQIVPYLCGQVTDPRCQERDQWAVDRAKYNIDQNYAFVGLLDELEMSLAVLEQLLPEFYKDARSLVKQDSFVKMKNGTLTTFKKPASEKSREYLMTQTSLKYEYQIYDHVLEKLKRRYSQLQDTL